MAEETPEFKPPKRANKAYLNPLFLKSRDARMVRILCEYLEPLQRFQRLDIRETIVFFGSARARPPVTVKSEYDAALEEKKRFAGKLPKELRHRLAKLEGDMRLSIYYEEAAELSALVTQWAKSLGQGRRFVICSGGGPGIMEAANRGAHDAGGKSMGLGIRLPNEMATNRFISPELNFYFHYFFMRKLWFAQLAKALVVFPGGFGTMDELWEFLTLQQTGKVPQRHLILIYGRRYWDEVLNWRAMLRWGTINQDEYALLQFADTVDDAFERVRSAMEKYHLRPSSDWQ